MKSYIKTYIEADWTAAEALTELAKRLDANSGAGLVTADEHDALVTITESGCNWQAEIKTKDAEAADLRRKLAQARDEAARLGELLAGMLKAVEHGHKYSAAEILREHGYNYEADNIDKAAKAATEGK